MDLILQLDALTRGLVSGCSLIVMVQSTHHWKRDHVLACVMRGKSRPARFRNLLPDALMRSSLIEVLDIGSKGPLQLVLLQDQQVIEAFLPHTPQKAFADSIGSWGMNWRFEDLDRARFRHPSKAGPKFGIVIPNEILGCLPIGRGFPKLLCAPRVGWRSCHAHVDHLP